MNSRNFTLQEIKHVKNAPTEHALFLMGAMQVVRDIIGHPCVITSGYRAPKHNQLVGGVPTSYHVWRTNDEGQILVACDFEPKGISVKEAFNKLKAAGIKGIILYPNHIHYTPSK